MFITDLPNHAGGIYPPAGDDLVRAAIPPGIALRSSYDEITGTSTLASWRWYLPTERAGVGETVQLRALLVYYDPLVVGYEELTPPAGSSPSAPGGPAARPPVELPLLRRRAGFELEAAAAKLGLAPEEVARSACEADYYVYFVGFTPGLPYMTGMPERLTIPRLTNPRLKTPPGSVSIGGVQCCIYSVESPGGFWVLGRTPVRLYAPTATDPILLRAGDHVRFRPVDRAEYDAIAVEVDAGRYVPRIAGPVTTTS
jgi:inhibitor of KinA